MLYRTPIPSSMCMWVFQGNAAGGNGLEPRGIVEGGKDEITTVWGKTTQENQARMERIDTFVENQIGLPSRLERRRYLLGCEMKRPAVETSG